MKNDVAQHEVKKISDKKSLETMKEIVDNLTENKLAQANKIDLLEKQLTRYNQVDIENEALKRQLQRLTDENDSLLLQIESVDTQLIKTKIIPAEDELDKQIEALKMQVLSLEKQLEEKTRESKSLQDLVDHNSAKIKSLIQENSDLKDSIEVYSNSTPTDQVKMKYDKCIKKLKLYREKIYEISEKLTKLKADREILLKTTKNYSEYISKWQNDLANASIKMIERINDLNRQSKLNQQEIDDLKTKVELLNSESESKNDSEKVENDLRNQIEALKEMVKSKDVILEEERECQRKLKENSKKVAKKTSVLDLEMEAYEKTLDELNKKLEVKKLQEKEFENIIKIQKETMESLKCQISSLEANLESEKLHSVEVKKSLDLQQSLLRKTEHERTESNLQLELLTKSFEALKLENAEIKLEMSKEFGMMEKRYQSLETERYENTKTISYLEGELEKFKKLSLSQEKDIEDLRSDYNSYKLRAQSVLASRNTTDHTKEQELQDEIRMSQKALENIKDSNNKLKYELEVLKNSQNELAEDKIRLQGRCKELLETLEKHSEEVLEESKKRNQSHDESIKAYQLQIDTLNAFYKKKLQEKEDIKSSTVSELRDKILILEKSIASSSLCTFDSNIFQMKNEDHKMNVSMMDRTEAEGSEDQSSQSSTFQIQTRRKTSKSSRELMPLDELLNSTFDDNQNEINEETFSNFSNPSDILEHIKAKLTREENRVAHLTSLLADNEKDLARMQQLNEMLKEEIRRQQRNVDREEHIKNSEYLKNIVIKFVTLGNGDEKQRLIPVINTILKLSSEENILLQNACKGGWSGLWNK